MTTKAITRIRFAAILALLAGTTLVAGPSRFGFSDRVERHMFPEITTGPAEPSWSPDGKWIAVSMQGDIWKIPADGGEAVALTHGPWTYFEPDWSPDGASIVCTIDTGGNLDIGVVSANGGEATRLTDGKDVDVEPVWSRDGHDIFFVRSAGQRFDLFKLHAADKTVAPIGPDAGEKIQPAVSPDGKFLAYVAPVRGRLGTGGLWVRPIDNSAPPTMVVYQESEYRMRPRWTPDGKSLVYGTDEMGTNDIATVAVAGGNAVVITNDPNGEFSPAVSPDGKSIAFISNRTGPMTLDVAPLGGGPVSSWRDVKITSRKFAVPTGHVHGRVVDSAGAALISRVEAVGSDGRGYAPNDGFARVIAVTETPYFHSNGTFDLDVPAGPLKLTALKGFEYAPAESTVDVKAGQTATVTITVRRMIDGPAQGWYSGETHAHDLHQGRFGLTHKTLYEQAVAEDLHITNVLIHMDGTRLMGRWADLTGKPDPLSTPTHILQFGEEYRGSLGHIGMMGISKYVLPLENGLGDTAYAQVDSDVPYLDGAVAQGGLAGYMHPYTRASQDPTKPNPQQWSDSLITVDVGLGKGAFYDVESVYSDELGSAEMYYRFLNVGFKLASTGGTDNFPDVWRDPPVGTDRTFVKITGPLSLQSWMNGIKAEHTFGTTGPLLFLTVNGHEMGDEIAVTGAAPMHVVAKLYSIAPVDRIEIIANGVVAQTMKVPAEATASATGTTFTADVALPEGGWIAARAVGPSSRHIADSYAFAQTSPVYVVRNGTRFISKSDAAFLAAVVDAIAARTSRSPWRSDAERDAFKQELDSAKAAYTKLAGGS